MRISIKIRFSIFLALLLISTVSVLSILVLQGIRSYQTSQYEYSLSQQCKVANVYLKQSYLVSSGDDEISPQDYLRRKGNDLARELQAILGTQVAFYDNDGVLIGSSWDTGKREDIRDTLGFALEGKAAYQISGGSIQYFEPVFISGSESLGVVQIYYTLRKDIYFYNTVRNLFIGAGTLIFILSFIAGYLYFNRFTNLILRLKKITEDIKDGKFGGFKAFKRKDELGDLSQGIFFMSNRIEENIESLKEEQEKLRLAVNKLKVVGEQQKQFIGNVTHEFKTPITTIKTYIDLMEMYPDDMELMEKYKVNVGKEIQRLYDMVEKTLYLASLEKYEFGFEAQRIEVSEFLKDLCLRMSGKIQKYGLEMITDFRESYINADREALTHIIVNILDNAIKYNTANGKIFAKNYILKDSVNIEIADTGIGIPEHLRVKVFEPFYTVDRSRSRERGGAGLGLSLVKQLVQKQRGTIEIYENTYNGEKIGTIVLISLPLYKDSGK